MTRHATPLSLVCLLGVLAGASAAVGAPPQAAPVAQATAEGVTATVRAMDTKARTLEVITGVGYATRLMRVRVGPECQIRAAGEPAQLGDLKVGSIVRMHYRETPAGMLAEKIETLAVQTKEGQR